MSNDSNSNVNGNGSKQRSSYTCLCNFGYYVPNQTLQGFEGQDVESNAGNYTCIRCPGGCAHCNEKGECSDGEPQEYFLTETLLRFSIAVILGSCIFSCLILAIIVFRQRKCKVKKKISQALHIMFSIRFARDLFRVTSNSKYRIHSLKN